MLSTTFSTIVSNATAEIQFRRAVLTLEGVKSDAIFDYPPPFNVLALIVLLPLKLILSPRWFHKVNVTAVRIINAPVLLIIRYVERRILLPEIYPSQSRPRSHSRTNLWNFSRGFSVHADIEAVFDDEPAQPAEEQLEGSRAMVHYLDTQNQFENAFTAENMNNQQSKPGKTKSMKNRRDSVMPFEGLGKQIRELLAHEDDDEDKEGLIQRLENVEKSTLRIEAMMEKLLESLGAPGTGEEGNATGDTGSLTDLDKSGTADLDDD